MAYETEFIKLGNHREARKILGVVSAGANLAWFETAADTITRQWYRLAQQHLRIARNSAGVPRAWRVVVSRSYYATYNASKSVRYYVDGRVSLEADDHKKVGDLPTDLPERARWSNFATELRRDRNLADYDPWRYTRKALTHQPVAAMTESRDFLIVCRDYLKNRGLNL